MNKKRYTFFAALLALVTGFASCIQDDMQGNGQQEEITIHLSTGTRAAAGEDPLIYGEDEKFGSLALFVFDENENFVLLHKETFESGSANTHQSSFDCFSNAKKLLGVANYHLYPELDASLKTGLTLGKVKALVAQVPVTTTTGLTDRNILLVGETAIPSFADNKDKEVINVTMQLKRLTARVDIHAFKENGWTAKVELLSVEFNNGVLNTMLNPAGMARPAAPAYAQAKTIAFSKTLEDLGSGTDWKNSSFRNMAFYSYRTSQPQNNIHAPTIKLNVRINDNITKTYKAVIANAADAEAALDAGNVYQVKAVLSKTGLTVETSAAPWDREDSEVSYTDNLMYKSNGWMQSTIVAQADNTVQLTQGTNGILHFTLLAPDRAEWNAVLTNTTAFELLTPSGKYEADDKGNAIPQKLEIKVLTAENAQTELKVYAKIGGMTYELDLTRIGEDQKPSADIQRFTITTGEQ